MENDPTLLNPPRRIVVALMCYLAVAVFILSFIASSLAQMWFDLPDHLSELAKLTIAFLLAAPLLIPFVWERMTKMKVAGIEVDLVQFNVKTKEASPSNLGIFGLEVARVH